jgi:hypothetical protein
MKMRRYATLLIVTCFCFCAWSLVIGTSSGQSAISGSSIETDTPDVPYQPDYACWQQVTCGMSSNDVVALLGEPRNQGGCELVSFWDYGVLFPVSSRLPSPYAFTVIFVGKNVTDTLDPFEGVFSTNGIPTTPRLITPFNESVFDHHPRIVDFRWQPSSGIYPLTYEVDISAGYSGKVDMPCMSWALSRDGSHRWRVRAVNSLGKSPWSEWRSFFFVPSERPDTIGNTES